MNHSLNNWIDCSCSRELGHAGEIIKKARKYRGLSQSELATRCNLSPKMISLVECGNRNISWDGFQRVLKGLHFSVTFYPNEMQPMPEELAPILDEAIPNLQDMLILLKKMREISIKKAKKTKSGSSAIYSKRKSK